MMGSTNGEANEKPVHQVTISHSFYMGKYEVTQTQWKSLMGNNPAYFKYSKGCGGTSPCPVETISWDDVQKFLQKLNEMQDGYSYRLPTEAEWEYACRAGTTGDYSGKVGDIAWYKENSWEDSLNRTHPVGTKQPNAWGLADMHGNVWELCEDWYHDTYDGAPSDGTAWLNAGEQRYRMIRGGSFCQSASGVRSATRRPCEDCVPFYNVGFRVVAYVRTQ